MVQCIRTLVVFSLLAVFSPTRADEQTALANAWSALYGPSARNAVAAAEKVAQTHPDRAEAWQIRGRAYMRRAKEVNIFRKRGQLEQALAAYERAAGLDPANIEANVLLLSVYSIFPEALGGGEERASAQLAAMEAALPGLDAIGRAVMARAEGNDELAYTAVLEAIDVNPDEPQFRASLVQHHVVLEDWDAAWRKLDEARTDFPHDFRLQRLVARLAGKSGKRLNDGLGMLEKLADRDDLPSRIRPEELLLLRGRIMAQQGHVEEALLDFHRARETAPYLFEQLGFGADIESLEGQAAD